MDLNKFIQSQTETYISSDEFKEEVAKNVKTMVNDRIEDALRSYGAISQSIDEYIKEQCVLDISDLPAIGLSKLMISTIDEELDAFLRGDLKQKIIERVASITEPMPKVIDFMDLVKKMYNEKSHYNSCHNGEDDEFEHRLDYEGLSSMLTVIIEEERDDYWDVYLDDTEDTAKDRCEFKIGISKKHGHFVFYNGANDGRYQKPLNRFYGVASCLYKLQVQGSTVDVDSVQEFYDNYL